MKNRTTAETYASELLEFFVSHTSDQLKRYLEINPVDGLSTGGLGAYPLCSHVNILDRVRGAVLNSDPIAELPVFNDAGAPIGLKANRFFQVQIVDMTTMNVRRDICDKTARQIFLFGRAPAAGETTGLAENERFLITVGMTWPGGRNNIERVVLSTVIP